MFIKDTKNILEQENLL